MMFIHVVTFTLISILATDYIQKRRGQALLEGVKPQSPKSHNPILVDEIEKVLHETQN